MSDSILYIRTVHHVLVIIVIIIVCLLKAQKKRSHIIPGSLFANENPSLIRLRFGLGLCKLNGFTHFTYPSELIYQ